MLYGHLRLGVGGGVPGGGASDLRAAACMHAWAQDGAVDLRRTGQGTQAEGRTAGQPDVRRGREAD